MDILGQNVIVCAITMNTVSARYYFYILRILENMGLQKENLSDIIPSVKETESVTNRVSIDTLKALMKRAELELSNSHVGLHISKRFRISGYAYAGEIYSACVNTEQALAMSMKYSPLAHNIGKFEKAKVSDEHSIVKYTWEPSFKSDLIDSYRHIVECIVNNYLETIKWLTWDFGECVKAITFQHSGEAPLDEYDNIFGCKPIFNASETAIFLRQDILEKPLSTSNPVKLSLLEKRLNQLLAEYNVESDLIQRTKFVLHKIIQSRRPTVKMVAQELSLSERSFKRYLKNQGTKYQDLLQEVKMELCAGYIKEGLPYPEIAQLLWYFDHSALTRAYKNWHGISPSRDVTLELPDE